MRHSRIDPSLRRPAFVLGLALVTLLTARTATLPAHAACPAPMEVGPAMQLTPAPLRAFDPQIAWTGTEYGVVWEDDRTGRSQVWFARLDPEGRKLGEDMQVTQAFALSGGTSRLVWNGSGYGVAWTARPGPAIYFARLDANGARVGPDMLVTSLAFPIAASSLVWNGEGYGIAWHDTPESDLEIYFARLDAEGAKIGGNTRVTADRGASIQPVLAWTGAEYGVAWIEDRQQVSTLHFTRISAAGLPLGPGAPVTEGPGNVEGAALTWDGAGFGLGWTIHRDEDSDVHFRHLDTTGNPEGAEVVVSDNPRGQVLTGMAFSGDDYGFAWYDRRHGDPEIFFRLVGASGAMRGPELRLTKAPGWSFAAALAWNGERFGVSWADAGGVPEPSTAIHFTQVGCRPGGADH